jgi:hypothetical protein
MSPIASSTPAPPPPVDQALLWLALAGAVSVIAARTTHTLSPLPRARV